MPKTFQECWMPWAWQSMCFFAPHDKVIVESVDVQMGGAEGMRKSEEVAITLAPSKGLFMHAEPRQT